MSIYFVPHRPSSGEEGGYNRRPTFFHFNTRPFVWKWQFSQGYSIANGFPPVRAIVDGVPVTDFLSPSTNEYAFTIDVPDGQHIITFEGALVPVLHKPFSQNTGTEPLTDNFCWTATSRFELDYGLCGNGYKKFIYPGALPTPKIFPLKPRPADPYNTVLPQTQLWARHQQMHTGAGMVRRWTRLPSGDLSIELDNKYFYSDVTGGTPSAMEPPPMTLRDGPRGVGTLGFLYKFIVNPSDQGCYWSDVNGRIGFLWNDGRVVTFAGWRLKEGELKGHSGILSENPLVHKAFYQSKWEHVGDWTNVPEPKRFNELWGIEGYGGHHEFWAADTLNNRVLYLNHYTAHPSASYRLPDYPAPGYTPPIEATGEVQLALFWADIEEPWSVKKKGEWLYASSFTGDCIKRKRLVAPFDVETVIQSSIHPSDTQLGIDTQHRLFQSIYTAEVLRGNYLIDGPLGTATCIRPQDIAFDSQGRLVWVERYTYVIRRLNDDGTVQTITKIGQPNAPITGKSFGTYDVSLAIDTEGTVGPVDDIFVNCWHDTDYRYASDGTYRGRIVLPSNKLMDGNAEHVRRPNYGWPIGIGHGRIYLQGSAGAWQQTEITKKQPTDPVIDVNRYDSFYTNVWEHSLLSMAHGPSGQGELGLPNIEEIGSWDDDTVRNFFSSEGVPSSQLDNGLSFVRDATVNIDYSGVIEPPPPETHMKNIVATITTTPTPVPVGSTPQIYRFGISGPRTETQDIPYGGALSAQFVDVADGTYVVTCELIDAGGARLGVLQSTQVTVTSGPTTVVIDAPAGLTVQVITV